MASSHTNTVGLRPNNSFKPTTTSWWRLNSGVRPMENSLYYTFSTIAQSLAAIMGLLGAFALFRLQSIEGDLRTRGSGIAKSFLGLKEMSDALAHEDYGQFLKVFDEHVATIVVTFAAYEQANIDRLRALVPLRSAITSSLKWSFFAVAVTMSGSVFVLTMVHRLAQAQLLLWLGLAAFLLCLLLQGILVARLLR